MLWMDQTSRMVRSALVLGVLSLAALGTANPVWAQSSPGGPGYLTTVELHLPTQDQGDSFTFTGTPGQYVSVTMQASASEQPSTITAVQIIILAPDFSLVANTVTTNFSCNLSAVGCYGNAVINLGPLPTYSAGTTYTVLATPTQGTGNLVFNVDNPFPYPAGPTVNGGPDTHLVLYPGQGGTMPIALTAGQQYTLFLSETGGNLPVLQGTLLSPTGTTVTTLNMTATCSASCNLFGYSGGSTAFFTAPVTGTYTLLVQQETQTSGNSDYGPIDGDSITVQIISP